MAAEHEICAKIAGIPAISSLVQDRILAMDGRADDWKNIVNYLGDPVQVIDPYGFMKYTVAVDRTGLRRSMVLRGPGRFMDTIEVWVYGPRGMAGYTNAITIMEQIQEFHQDSLPNRQMMMLSGTIGPLDDGKNLITNITFDLTRVLEDNHG